MKKPIYFLITAIAAVSVISGCSKDTEEKTSKEQVIETAKEVDATNEKRENESMNQTEKSTVEILDTVKVYGGGTFDLNGDLEKPEGIYVTENSDGNVFLTIRDNYQGVYRVASGNIDSWQSISVPFEPNYGQYPRGYYYFENENNELLSGTFHVKDTSYKWMADKSVPEGDKFILTNTSQGEVKKEERL